MTSENFRKNTSGLPPIRLFYDKAYVPCGTNNLINGCNAMSADYQSVNRDKDVSQRDESHPNLIEDVGPYVSQQSVNRNEDNIQRDELHPQQLQDVGSFNDNFSSQPDKHMSLWNYLYIELTRGYWLEYDKARFTERRKRVYLFLTIPIELEKFMAYGFFQCVDGFLFLFTFLPLRFIKAFFKFLVRGCFSSCWKTAGNVLNPAEICDLMKGIILLVCCLMMTWVDVSMMYHVIRGQTVIKLYIFFNMLDVADKLCSSFGQDILDSLFWTATEPRGRRREHFGLVIHVILAILYVFFHTILVLLQANTLNVAFNSHNKALLTIMMSNNFVELKGSVFKKFEKNNLFQMSCSDVRERFHLMFLLTIVVIRNLTDFSWNLEHVLVLIPDIIIVMFAELVVDWVKHAFITKFNELQPEVYRDYTLSIAYDMASSRHANAFCDHLDTVSRRMGFIPLPLAVLFVRVLTQSLRFTSVLSGVLLLLFYLCLLSFKVLNSIVLLGTAHQYILKNRQASGASRAHDQTTIADTKFVSKDDLHLLSSPKSTLPGAAAADSPAFRRTQSLGELTVDDELLVATIETPPLCENSLSDLSTGILRQSSFGTDALLSNSTVSLVSVQLNSTFVEDRMAATTVSNNTSLTDDNCATPSMRNRQKSECSGGLEETVTPLSEVNRYTMCSNRII